MHQQRPRLGFLGTGIMGSQMTLRLLERGWTVTAWNLEPAALDPLVAAGASRAASPAGVAHASDIVLLCVLNTEAVEAVVFGPSGAAEGARAGLLIVDHSTADPAATRAMAERWRGAGGAGWVDAPVSGGPGAARDGSLTIMAGGEDADVRTAAAVMRDLAGNLTHVGPPGAGQTVKLINQALVCTGYAVMAEALILAEAAGLDASRLPAALAGGHADGSLLRKLYPQMQARDFDPPRGYARQLLKDLKAVTTFAHGLGLGLPVIESATAQYAEYVAGGNALADSASIIRFYERQLPVKGSTS